MKKIALRGELGRDKFVLVDDEDYEILTTFRWHFRDGYAETCVSFGKLKKAYLMHRVIYLYFGKDEIDHRDRNRLNNQKYNLRQATHSQNQHNTGLRKDNKTGFKGVFLRESGRFRAYINIDGRRINLGTFGTALEAAIRNSQP